MPDPLPDLNSMSLEELYCALNPRDSLRALFALVRLEDVGVEGLDVTSEAMIPADATATGVIIAKSTGVIAGLRTIPDLVASYAKGETASGDRFSAIAWQFHAQDGHKVTPGEVIVTVNGHLREILVLERPVLNMLGRLSGIATTTRAFVDAIETTGSKAQILDTRKTTPGLRHLEKYAVRCGGGHCHRIGLHDAVLVKDNHLAGIAVSELTGALEHRLTPWRAANAPPLRFIEVEVDSLEQLEALTNCSPGLIDVVLLDNMPVETLHEAVRIRNRVGSPCLLEASGGVSLETVAAIASTGVERISTGAITHASRWLDLSLEIRNRP